MKIDPVALAQLLWEEPPAEQEPGVSAYLLEHVLAPYLHGEDIMIRDIDFTAFSARDMGGFLTYVNELAEENGMTERFWAALRQSSPMVVSAQSFC